MFGNVYLPQSPESWNKKELADFAQDNCAHLDPMTPVVAYCQEDRLYDYNESWRYVRYD